MSKVSLNYTELDRAKKNAKNSSDELEDYSSCIQKQIIGKLGDLPGEDSAGYISSAVTLAYQKCEQLSGKQGDFIHLGTQLGLLKGDAQYADSVVKNTVNSIAEENLEEESFWEKAGSALYNLFCVTVPDTLSQLPFFDAMIDWGRSTKVYLSGLKDDVVAYFNTGGGVYVKNVVKSAADVLSAAALVGSVVVGAAALPIIGTSLAVIALVAGGIYLIYKFVNMAVVTENNLEAYRYYQRAEQAEDETEKRMLLGYANYYAQTGDIADYAEKKDYGGKAVNTFVESTAEGYEDLSEFSSAVLNLIGVFTSFAEFGITETTVDGEIVKSYEFSFENVKSNVLEKVLKNEEKTLEKIKDPKGVFLEEEIDRGLNKQKKKVAFLKSISEFLCSDDVNTSEGWEKITDGYDTITKLEPLKGLLDPTVGELMKVIKTGGEYWDAGLADALEAITVSVG